jgi:hypothetical protein
MKLNAWNDRIYPCTALTLCQSVYFEMIKVGLTVKTNTNFVEYS